MEFLAIEIFDDSGVARRAERAKNKRDLVALHQTPGMFHRFRRTVGIVERDQVYFSTVDAAAIVDRLDVGHQTAAAVRQTGSRTAKRKGRAYFDLGGRYPDGRLFGTCRSKKRGADCGGYD